MRQDKRVRSKANFELQTLLDIIRLLKRVDVSYQAEMARMLGIKRQTMNELWKRIILPLSREGVFIVKEAPFRWGKPRYFVRLAPNWNEALLKWINQEVEEE